MKGDKMDEWRLIDRKYDAQPEAVLFSRVVLEAMKENRVPNTLSIRHIPQISLSLNYYEDPFRDINLEACREHGVVVKRRVFSGGGSVLLGPDYLGFSLCVNATKLGLSMEMLYQKVMWNLMNEATKAFKIPCRFKPLNDGEVWDPDALIWRKIALSYVGGGSSEALDMGVSITFYRPRYDLLDILLTPPAEKFSDKETKSVVERVANFEEILGRRIELEERKKIYIDAIENAFDVRLIPEEPLDEELQKYDKLRRVYVEGDDFLFKRTEKNFGTIESHIKKGENVLKIANGPVCKATVLIESNTLKEVLFTGTMSAYPTECFERLEESLRGIQISDDAIKERIENMYSSGARTAMLTKEDVFQVLRGAIKSAKKS